MLRGVPEAAIEVHALHKRYGDVEAVRGLSVRVERAGSVVGAAVHPAARRSQAARGGAVLLREATRAAARRRRSRFEQRGARTFRNARDPVVVYAASERLPLRTRLLALKRRFACPAMGARTKAA